jgi:hypothetical protein
MHEVLAEGNLEVADEVLAPRRRSPPPGIGRSTAPGSLPLGGVNEGTGLSHECLSVGLGDEMWGIVHVVLGRKDSS